MTFPSSSSLRFERRRVPSYQNKKKCQQSVPTCQSYKHTLFLVSFLAFLSCASDFSWNTVRWTCFTAKTHLGVPQQLHNPSLVRRESSNLSDDRPHKLGFGRLHTLALAGADRLGDGSSWAAVVDTD